MNEYSRFFLKLAYRGTRYHGWQIQPNAETVQQILNRALSIYYREEIETTGCGRTDAGVHAREFYAHFDVEKSKIESQKSKFLTSLNALLPYDIAIEDIIPVKNNAHARFDATLRAYQYHIHYHKDPFKHNLSWLIRDHLNIKAMNNAAKVLIEYNDFSCFSKSNTQVFTNHFRIF